MINLLNLLTKNKTSVKELQAFPKHISADVGLITVLLSVNQMHKPLESENAMIVMGESIHIPSRVYYEKFRVLDCTTHYGIRGLISLCLGTRHYDGYLRQKCLEQLIMIEEPWVVPFIVHLLGEYVIEIIEVIASALPNLNSELYSDFLIANPRYFATTERRVISYWNVYYRHRYKDLKDYPGYKVLQQFHIWATHRAQ